MASPVVRGEKDVDGLADELFWVIAEQGRDRRAGEHDLAGTVDD